MNTTTSRVITRGEVEQAMRDGRYAAYLNYAGQLAEHLSRRGVNAGEVQTYARQRGLRITDREAQDFIDRLAPATTAASTGGTSIRDTVLGSLPPEASGYARYAEPVILALEERERDITAQVCDAAVETGMSRDEVLSTLTSAGLTPPTMTMGSSDREDDNIGRIEREVSRLSGLVDRLKRAAEARGIHI